MRTLPYVMLLILTMNACSEEPTGKDFSLHTTVAIKGNASGGTVTLIMPYGSVSIITVPGDTSEAVADKLLSELYKLQNSHRHSRKDAVLRIGSAIKGQVALKSTDAGIENYRAVENLAAAPENNGVKVAWTRPANTSYDEIYIFCNGVISRTIVTGATLEFVDDLGMSNPIRRKRLKNELQLEYRVIGIKDGTPSDVASIIISNPRFGQ